MFYLKSLNLIILILSLLLIGNTWDLMGSGEKDDNTTIKGIPDPKSRIMNHEKKDTTTIEGLTNTISKGDIGNNTKIKDDQTNEDKPDIYFEGPDYNFGEIFMGDKVEHIFRFKNLGKGKLEIDKIQSSCGCTAAIISSKDLSYEERGEVKVTFNSQSYSGDVTKKVTVYSNDPDTPDYKLTISGKVMEEVVVTPKQLDFSQIPYGVDEVKEISVRSATDLKLKIENVSSTNPDLAVSFKENVDKDGYIVSVLVKNNKKYGRIDGKIFIYTNSKHQEKIIVPFHGEIIGDLSVYPPRISCGVITRNKEMTFPVFVISHKKDISVDRVEVSPDFLEAEIAKKPDDKKTPYKILITLKKDAPLGRINGKLMIFTNSVNQSVIEVPIVGEIRRG